MIGYFGDLAIKAVLIKKTSAVDAWGVVTETYQSASEGKVLTGVLDHVSGNKAWNQEGQETKVEKVFYSEHVDVSAEDGDRLIIGDEEWIVTEQRNPVALNEVVEIGLRR